MDDTGEETQRAAELPLPMILEGVLFVSAGPVAVADLAKGLDRLPVEIETALAELAGQLSGRGLRLQRQGDAAQLVTAPEVGPDLARYLGEGARARLSGPALETLAIVAYEQPVTRARIEAIRGVSSERALSTLLARGLLAEVGRLETIGRPLLYGTTDEFLQQFGLLDLSQLCPLEPAP